MQVQCQNPQCGSRFEINDDLLVPGVERKVRCAFCQQAFYVTRAEEEASDFDPREVEQRLANLAQSMGEDPDAMGTMMLSLANKPKRQAPAPPKKSDQVRRIADREEESPATQALTAGKPLERLAMDERKKAGMLLRTRWLPGLSNRDLVNLAPYWEVVRARDRTRIFEKGDHNPFLGLVFAGEVRIFPEVDPRKMVDAVANLGPGASFGEASLFSNTPRVSFAVAIKDTYLLIITRKQFKALLEDHPLLALAVVQRLMDPLIHQVAKSHGPLIDALSTLVAPE